MTKDNAQLAFTALAYFTKLYNAKYNTKLEINKYKEKWGMHSLVEDFGLDKVKKAIDYYFALQRDSHTLMWFYNNCDVLLVKMDQKERDDRLREERRKKTQELKEEFYNADA